MSGTVPTRKPPRLDRRVRRTRDALGDALVALITETPFDTIKVRDVLDRAGVSRSTFYTHYRDKNDLFLSDVEEFWERMAERLSVRGEASDRVAPVRELLEHAGGMGGFRLALVASGRMEDVLDLGRGHFARGIERRLTEAPRTGAWPAAQRAALAQALAGALMSLMTWWLDHERAGSPAEMDALFHRLVRAGAGS
jgi:AcrR family transcriptional regulator